MSIVVKNVVTNVNNKSTVVDNVEAVYIVNRCQQSQQPLVQYNIQFKNYFFVSSYMYPE